jgi:hypothetical protein
MAGLLYDVPISLYLQFIVRLSKILYLNFCVDMKQHVHKSSVILL